ncbi:hypothetical protein GCM10022224_018890 [Nonomuraea antimicrobica]|uniref:Uncharacterized protein n=1 Tax=Nonomuraea antimicrobica TaxID=561173 RepID=A0ABP7BEV1_9ACTN
MALLLDELPEQLVAQLQEHVLAVGGLAHGEQPGPGREQPHDGGGLDGLGGVFYARIHAFNGIFEPSVEAFARFLASSPDNPKITVSLVSLAARASDSAYIKSSRMAEWPILAHPTPPGRASGAPCGCSRRR